jgi:hypothetical protein
LTTLLSDALFEEVLLSPVRKGADRLLAVSGYASPAMVTRHLNHANTLLRQGVCLDLVVGMTGQDGLPINTHLGFRTLASQESRQFVCSYMPTGLSVHSKVYIWMQGPRPVEAWVGSANYTQNGFGVGRQEKLHFEVMTQTSPDQAVEYFDFIASKSVLCTDEDVERHVIFHPAFQYPDIVQDIENDHAIDAALQHLDQVSLPLFITSGHGQGTVHSKSGLNWGQRVVNGKMREPNQAYIPVPSHVARSGFFPPRGVHFNMTTMDGSSMLMTVAQEGSKALQSTESNSIIGRYFRMRLQVPDGQRVTISDLDRYGNRYVNIYKLADDEFLLDY